MIQHLPVVKSPLFLDFLALDIVNDSKMTTLHLCFMCLDKTKRAFEQNYKY